jgi:excisionase family DNA binding protein
LCANREEATRKEAELHKKFKTYRMHHEWFSSDPCITKFAKENTVSVSDIRERLGDIGRAQDVELRRKISVGECTLTTSDLANKTGLKIQTIKRLVCDHSITYLQLGRTIRFMPTVIDEIRAIKS